MFSLVSSLNLLLSVSVFFVSSPYGDCAVQCLNNGTLTVNDDGKDECKCPSQFAGKLCEDFTCGMYLNLSISYPVSLIMTSVNGLSTWNRYNPESFFFNKRCLCDPGWTGELCDKSLIHRCGDNGEDIGEICKCRKHFIGERCQYVTKCTHGQLYNGR
jgi:hypothetical protein